MRRKQARRAGGRGWCVEPLERRQLLSVNVLVHHGDPANDGVNAAETVLNPADVNTADFGKQFTTVLDGYEMAQPLYVQNVDITRGPDPGVHSVVYVATMHDSLYAIDAGTGAVLWQDSFLDTADPTNLTPTAGVTTIPAADVLSTSIGPELGILATPAIDMGSGEIFLNAATKEIRGGDLHYVQRLWAVSLSDGAAATAPAVIGDTISNGNFASYTGYQYVAGPIVDGSGNNATPAVYPNTDGWASAPGGEPGAVIAFNALLQMQRTSVTLLNGNVYLGFASHGDHGPYYGWLLGYAESNLSITAAFVTTPTYEGITGDTSYGAQGGIWSSGSAIATDGTYLYVATGNGTFDTNPANFDAHGFPIDHNYGDSLLKLALDTTSSPADQNGNGWGLSVADYFTPSNATELNDDDYDLGSGGVLLLPASVTDAAGNPMLVFGGKESRLYLVDRNNLGKFNSSFPTTGSPDPADYDRVLGEYFGTGGGAAMGFYSTPIYYDGDLYVGEANSTAKVFNLSTFASGTVPPGTNYPTPIAQTPAFGYPDPTFTLTSNNGSNALLWAVDTNSSQLEAFNPASVAAPLYSSSTISTDITSDMVKFAGVTVANGGVYIGTTAGTLVGYGLRSSYLQSNPGFSSAPTNLRVTAVSPAGNQLSWTDNAALAAEYRVGRSTDGVNWTTLSLLSNGSTIYDDTTAVAGTTYQYRVVALPGPSAGYVSPYTTPPLVGTVIGTTGSFQNDGNVAAYAFDGNLASFFDGPTAGTATTPNWVGLDLGGTYAITSIAYAGRSVYESRMDGGMFQASNDPTFITGTVTLYTVGATENPPGTSLTTRTVNTNGIGYRYVRYLGPVGSFGDVSEVQFFGVPLSNPPVTPPATPLTGSVIGTAGSFKNDGNTAAKAFDGNLSTYVDGPSAGTASVPIWIGLDLGSTYAITSLAYASRNGWASRMNGGIFQASNDPTFVTGDLTIYTIGATANPSSTALTVQTVSTAGAGYRYVRYLSPAGSYGDVAEVQFFGTAAPAATPPTTPPSTPTPAQVGGVVIGTAGSFKNDGNTAAKAFDGNLFTFFDGPSAGTAATPIWVGLDLGSTYAITSLAYASRSGWAGRMNGGIFQASNDPTFATGDVTLFTIPASANPSSTALTIQTVGVTGGYRYVRYLAPAGSYGDVAEVQFFGTASSASTGPTGPTTPTPVALTGTPIGTAGSYKNDGNTIANVFDGNLSTFFDGPSANGNWVGLDLGTAAEITTINYAPRSGYGSRMVGGIFQGSDTPDFSAGVMNLYTITTAPAAGVLTSAAVTTTQEFRYVRYLSPAGSYGDIAELQFVGTPDAMTATLTADLTVAQAQAQKTITAIGTTANFPQYTNPDGTWSWVNAGHWTAGFLPALLWQLYDANGDAADKTEATQLTLAVNAASENETSDNGFRMYLTDLPLLQQNPGDAPVISALFTAAAAKSTTFNAAVGGFEAWRSSTSGNPLANFNVLMDMIMDLPLQLWAAKQGGNTALYNQAIAGAVTEENNLVRPDGSSAQFAYFNSTTGQFIDNETYEGYSATSTWARGQAWGIYGFTKLAALTGRSDFLATAEKMADWYLAHLPSDDVPYWDFDAPGIPNTYRDTTAAAVAASGLIQLSDLLAATDPADAATYRSAAAATLASLSSAPYLVNPTVSTEGDGILLQGALNVPATPSIDDNSVVFGDYYFIEAINEYLSGS